jgi:hypothetical protein
VHTTRPFLVKVRAAVSGPTVSDLEPALDAALPEYMQWLRARDDWTWERDDAGTVFLILEHLRPWLRHLGRRHGEVRKRAWEAVERLASTSDELLLNGLEVGLLEGHWPRRDKRLWGPLTRALWDDVQAPYED